VLEDLKEGTAVVTTGAAIGIDEQPLQKAFLAQVLHVLERLVPFLGGCFHLAGGGGLELEFSAGDLALQLLLLPLGLLEALVLVGVDLGELGELALDRAQLPLQLVGLAPLRLEGIGWFGTGSLDLLAGLIEGLIRVEVVVLKVVVFRLRLVRGLLVGPVLRLRVADELLMLGTVNKAFRRSVDQLVLAIINCETNLKLDASSLRWEKNANHQAADWIALGCVKFVREAKMRGEPQSNNYVRSFMYTVAYQMADNSFN
jgi:hypothetical protein